MVTPEVLKNWYTSHTTTHLLNLVMLRRWSTWVHGWCLQAISLLPWDTSSDFPPCTYFACITAKVKSLWNDSVLWKNPAELFFVLNTHYLTVRHCEFRSFQCTAWGGFPFNLFCIIFFLFHWSFVRRGCKKEWLINLPLCPSDFTQSWPFLSPLHVK